MIGVGRVRHAELLIIKALPMAIVVLVKRVQADIAGARDLLGSGRLQVVDTKGAPTERTVQRAHHAWRAIEVVKTVQERVLLKRRVLTAWHELIIW